jgi:hypothetical protein
MYNMKKYLCATIAAMAVAAAANATDRTFNVASGNWNVASNWSPNDDYPRDGDKSIIPNGKTCTVNISNARADAVEVQSGGVLIIAGSQLLELDSASSVADAQGVQLAGSGSVLKASGSFTFSGAGSIQGQHDAAEIEIAAGFTLTSTTTFEGQFQIQGLVPTGPGTNGSFVNNGTVHANVDGGTLLVVSTTVLAAGTGNWVVDVSNATLEFDAGSACGTEIGDLTFDDGFVKIDADVTFDNFHWDGGTIQGTDMEHMRYETFSTDASKSNPQDGTESCTTTYYYVDDYPVS